VSLNQVLQFLEDDPQLKQHLPAVKAYREQFGVQ
jgi:orotate phosphoribosyltransferase